MSRQSLALSHLLARSLLVRTSPVSSSSSRIAPYIFSLSTPFRVILSGLSVPHSFRVAGVSGEERSDTERTEARGMRNGG